MFLPLQGVPTADGRGLLVGVEGPVEAEGPGPRAVPRVPELGHLGEEAGVHLGVVEGHGRGCGSAVDGGPGGRGEAHVVRVGDGLLPAVDLPLVLPRQGHAAQKLRFAGELAVKVGVKAVEGSSLGGQQVRAGEGDGLGSRGGGGSGVIVGGEEEE